MELAKSLGVCIYGIGCQTPQTIFNREADNFNNFAARVVGGNATTYDRYKADIDALLAGELPPYMAGPSGDICTIPFAAPAVFHDTLFVALVLSFYLLAIMAILLIVKARR
jgi:hypothetical protein